MVRLIPQYSRKKIASMGDNCLDSDQHTRDCKTLQPRDPESTSILALSHTYVLQYAGGLAGRRQWCNIFNNVSRYETFLRKVVGIGIARWIWQNTKFHANTLEMSLFLYVHNLNFRVTFYVCTCTPCMRHSAGRRNSTLRACASCQSGYMKFELL